MKKGLLILVFALCFLFFKEAKSYTFGPEVPIAEAKKHCFKKKLLKSSFYNLKNDEEVCRFNPKKKRFKCLDPGWQKALDFLEGLCSQKVEKLAEMGFSGKFKLRLNRKVHRILSYEGGGEILMPGFFPIKAIIEKNTFNFYYWNHPVSKGFLPALIENGQGQWLRISQNTTWK